MFPFQLTHFIGGQQDWRQSIGQALTRPVTLVFGRSFTIINNEVTLQPSSLIKKIAVIAAVIAVMALAILAPPLLIPFMLVFPPLLIGLMHFVGELLLMNSQSYKSMIEIAAFRLKDSSLNYDTRMGWVKCAEDVLADTNSYENGQIKLDIVENLLKIHPGIERNEALRRNQRGSELAAVLINTKKSIYHKTLSKAEYKVMRDLIQNFDDDLQVTDTLLAHALQCAPIALACSYNGMNVLQIRGLYKKVLKGALDATSFFKFCLGKISMRLLDSTLTEELYGFIKQLIINNPELVDRDFVDEFFREFYHTQNHNLVPEERLLRFLKIYLERYDFFTRDLLDLSYHLAWNRRKAAVFALQHFQDSLQV